MTKYELERLPETAAGKRMYARVSPVYEQSRFMKLFYDALGGQWDLLRSFMTTLREQHYIDTVDWGIEYLEHKYSLEPRPDLTLEERRARLGIKARSHRPLNPAVMEQHIKDEFGLDTYLDEDEPGHIHLFANWLSEVGWRQLIPWLLKEKPAHLVLDATLHTVIYTGNPPAEGDATSGVILPGSIPLPKSEADKKHYRRISAGGVLLTSGMVELGLRKAKDALTKIYAGGVQVIGGSRTVGLRAAKSSKVELHVGCPVVMFREVLIDSRDKPLFNRIKENPIADLAIANVAIGRGDNFVEAPLYDFLRIFFKFPGDNYAKRFVTLRNPREDVTRQEIKAVADYAVSHELLLNKELEHVSQAPRANLIAKRITTLI